MVTCAHYLSLEEMFPHISLPCLFEDNVRVITHTFITASTKCARISVLVTKDHFPPKPLHFVPLSDLYLLCDTARGILRHMVVEKPLTQAFVQSPIKPK